MTRFRRRQLNTFSYIVLVSLASAGCGQTLGGGNPGGGKTDDPSMQVDASIPDRGDDDPVPARVEVSLTPDEIAVGESAVITATAVTQSNDTVTSAPMAEIQIAPTELAEAGDATITGGTTRANIEAIAEGSVTITATIGALSSEATLTISAGGDEPCEGVMYICDQKYYSCDGGETWEESTPGACTEDTPENCSCGHYLGLVSEGAGYCTDPEPPFDYVATCDCDYCVPE